MNATKKAIDIVGGQTALANKTGISQAAISKLARGINRVSPESAVKIELATDGRVTRSDLRPDIFGTAA